MAACSAARLGGGGGGNGGSKQVGRPAQRLAGRSRTSAVHGARHPARRASEAALAPAAALFQQGLLGWAAC